VTETNESGRRLALVQLAAAAIGRDDYLEIIIRCLADALEVRWAFVSELVVTDPTTARTLAFWGDGGYLDNVAYPLEGTPCADVYDHSVCVVTAGVQAAYPDDHMLAEMGAEAYVGLPFRDEGGRAIGHLGVMHDGPVEADLVDTALFRVFAALAGSEFSRRRAEEEKARVERRLMEAERREHLGLLAGTIAHDLNNLLVGITANVGLAEGELPAASEARPYLRAIEETGQRAAELARQMLAYSGRGRFEVGPVDLARLVRETTDLLRSSLPRTAAIDCHVEAAVPPVQGDTTQLRQLVMNLVVNGVEALEGSPGQISVRLRPHRFDPAKARAQVVARDAVEGTYVALEVKDDGMGMDDATLNRVFDPFFTTKPKGNGLGLAAVQGIVQGNHGALLVDSAPGEGTTFRVLLPTSSDAPAPAPKAPAAAEFPAGLRALVVDDEAMVRAALTSVLKRNGFSVVQAADGTQAVTVLQASTDAFDVVLMDLSMPHMGGDEVVDWMTERMARIPIVLMSGYDRHELAQRFPPDSVTAFLQKPFTLQGALGAVRVALQAETADP